MAVPLAGAAQAVPQAPQFWVSPETLRHRLWQATYPLSQVKPQVPVEQVAVPFAGTPQAAPQVEQSSGSEPRDVHLPLQLVWPAGQVAVQIPAEHTSPAAQAFPQAPQFCGSEASATQLCPQAT